MDKYICPKCRKQLTEDNVIRCVCPFCHSIFDQPESGEKTVWKSLQAGMKSGHSEHIWKIGRWYEIDGEKSNEKDFCASERVIDAMQDVPMEVLAQVEVNGEHFIRKGDKEYWQKMQVVNAWKWEKKYSVALAIFAAELTLQNYEKKYPSGDLPHKTIEAAKKWLHMWQAEEDEDGRRVARSYGFPLSDQQYYKYNSVGNPPGHYRIGVFDSDGRPPAPPPKVDAT